MEQFPYELGFDHRTVAIPDLYGHQGKGLAVDLVADQICQRPRRFHLGSLDMRELDPLIIGYEFIALADVEKIPRHNYGERATCKIVPSRFGRAS